MFKSSYGRLPAAMLAVALLVIALPGAVLAETPPARMTGEALISFGAFYTHVECNPDGESAVTYEATGTAYGPYPGTFRETGQFTFGPQVGPVVHTGVFATSHTGQVTDFQASFTIESAVATVTGTKQWRSSYTSYPAVASCSEFDGDDTVGDIPLYNVTGELTYMRIKSTYVAQIHVVGGSSWQDRGWSQVEGHGMDIQTDTSTPIRSSRLNEDYTSLAALEPIGPAFVALDPPAAVNPVGTQHTVTATVSNSVGGPVANASVLFAVSGSMSASGSCTTDSLGLCDFTYTGPQLPGADIVVGCADSDRDGAIEPGEPCGEALKAWILPASTPGQVTGGGFILDPTDNEKVSFGFNAQSTSNGIKGNCSVVDGAPTRNVKIKCLTVTSLVQTATHATFFGQAEVNGVLTDYRIDVDDNAEPGTGLDTFKIVTGTGYSAAGTLDGGNIQVHRAE